MSVGGTSDGRTEEQYDDDDAEFVEHFDGDRLDPTVWLAHYLPMWSSREQTAASYRVEGSCLHLDIPIEQGRWCAGDHEPPLRVSGIATGNRSGPVGSTRGQQRYREGLLVREEQPRFAGWLPGRGRIAVRCRMSLSPRSMAALWLSGFEEAPDEAGELCVVEVFGTSLRSGTDGPSAEVGMGVKALHDPHLRQDFAAPRLPIDVAEFHTYVVTWDAQAAVFSVDGHEVATRARPPTYPMQLMVAVFDFPDPSTGSTADPEPAHVPELVVDWIRGPRGTDPRR